MSQTWIVYIVKCRDNTLYTGITTNLEKRIIVHNLGKASKYTASRLPVTLMWSEVCESESLARKREHHIKQLTRVQKQKLIK